MKVAESPVYQDVIRQKLVDRRKQKFFEEYLSEKKPEELPEDESSGEEKSPVMQYYDFVMDRIKNGPPKYQTGSQAMSVKEWDRLLDKVDDCIDAIRDEQEERQEKLKEKKEKEETRKEE